tara:strand:+ start:751 stop:960 length:210 start_codon:yes stop_codon:yes gene_type:complete
MKLVKIKDKPNLMRDMNSGAILNTDIAAFNLHKKEKELKEQTKKNTIEINNMKSDISEIKNMMKELLER